MFESLQSLAVDPLLGLITQFNNDSRDNKIDLGVGVYRDAQGQTPVLDCVKRAEATLLAQENSKAYVGPGGNSAFNQAMIKLAFGEGFSVEHKRRIVALQTPGGCGALRLAAELVVKTQAAPCLWVSNPTWANHEPLLGGAGLNIRHYSYYNYDTNTLDFDAMLADLEQAKAGDLVLLHAACHNPSGQDLSIGQWSRLADCLKDRSLIPLIDMAYQGFGSSLDDDAAGLRLVANTVDEMIVCLSCSKNFGLYRERVGAVMVLAKEPKAAEVCLSHLFSIARGIYSMPPSHGASIVAEILGSESLQSQWQGELNAMRDRILTVRKSLASKLQQETGISRFDFIARQKGMFSFLGVSPAQVEALAADQGVYMAGTSRISLAGLNPSNIDRFVHAVCSIL
ncbi:MAG: aspartate aminotransferase [Flavobacteriales bacterium]|jgi:aspartate aminotransferase